MAINTYLNIDPIKGESTDDKHKDWIEVLNFSHGLSLPQSSPIDTSGRASARADFSPLTVNKLVDKASVDLHLYCAQGKQIAKLDLELCREAGEKKCYLKYEMEDVLVSSVHITGGDSERATESVTFVYGTISWTYTATNIDGTEEKIGPKKWSLQLNKAE
jgi:type VI secretion system secreted protein Hcp